MCQCVCVSLNLHLIHRCCVVSQFCMSLFVQMLTVDLSILVSGLDRVDSSHLEGIESDSVSQLEISADSISQWEAELLQERLHELLHAEDEDEAKPQVRSMTADLYRNFHAETSMVLNHSLCFLLRTRSS